MKNNFPHLAAQVRIDALKMIYAAQSGHPGSSFSSVDILVSLFFGGFLKFDPKNPQWEERDYFIMSKGHGAPALYAIMGELGYFSKDEFFSLRQVDSLLQGHPEAFIPGVEIASGPLGQGMSVANGIALSLQIDNKPNKVFSLHGDGELQEGNIWEAVMTAAKYKLGNYVAIVDRNHLQIDGPTDEVCPVGDVAAKFRAFDWEVMEMNGHDFDDIEKTITKAIEVKRKPVCIVAETVKGKGVSFMENQVGWHGTAPNDEQFEKAMEELTAEFEKTK
jgi:transketolase